VDAPAVVLALASQGRAAVPPVYAPARLRVALATALALGIGGCAARTGWERTTSRVCEAGGPPVVCVVGTPDAPLEIRAGGETILPAECARAPARGRGGPLRATVIDGRGARGDAWVRVRRGRRTTIAIDDRTEPVVASRERCDRTP
jgi:hypothetical protein